MVEYVANKPNCLSLFFVLLKSEFLGDEDSLSTPSMVSTWPQVPHFQHYPDHWTLAQVEVQVLKERVES